MHIAYLFTYNGFNRAKIVGGSASHICGAVNALSKRCKITFIGNTRIDGIDSNVETNITNYVPSLEIFKEIQKMKFNLFFYNKIKRFFESNKFDLIYQRYSDYDWVGLKLARAFRIPLFLEFNSSAYWNSIHNWDRRTFNNLLRYSERILAKSANKLFVVSDVMRKNLIKEYEVDDRKVISNPNGVDVNRFSPANVDREHVKKLKSELAINNKKVVGFVGTFGPWHGIDVIVNSMKKLIPQRKDVVFLLIGDGELWDFVKQNMEKYKLQSNVILVGKVNHYSMPSYLSICNVLLNPTVRNSDGSDFFGSPTKLFEYMAMEKPVISSKVGQLKSIIEHKSNGFLINEGDYNMLNKYIVELVDNPEMATHVGAKARKTVINEYTWELNAGRIIDCYKNI